jgi:hypothetical protein
MYVGNSSAVVLYYVSSIMFEMDRILRPGGVVFIHDALSIMDELVMIAKAIGWRAALRETIEGPHTSDRVLVCNKDLPPG